MQLIRTYSFSNVRKTLGHYKAKSLAIKMGTTRRKLRKFSVVDMLLAYWQLVSLGQFSYDDWASQISSFIGKTVSGQAVCKRMSHSMVEFIKELLNKSFKQKHDSMFNPELFKHFANAYIQDATHFSLPRILASIFPGSYSKYGESSTAKIQATFNIRKGSFSDFKLSSFRDNDQKDSPRIVNQLKSGDLLIRDLGYFVTNVFISIQNKGAYFLSRYKFGSYFYNESTGEKIDLLKHLKAKGAIDMKVIMGKKQKLTCRLVAVSLPEKVATERRRKAKADRNKRVNHSKEYLELLGYSIYITNVPNEVWTAEQVAKAYSARWYIEILFKGWKSKLKMKINIPERYITKQRAMFFLYASLLMIQLLIMPLFICAQQLAKQKGEQVSILICTIIIQRLYAILRQANMDNQIKQMVYYCTHEKRKSRVCLAQYVF